MSQFIDPTEKPDLDNALAHFGVKGMRWGVRKAESGGGGGSSSKTTRQQREQAIRKARSNNAKRREAVNKADRNLKDAERSGDKAKVGKAKVEKDRAVKELKSNPDYVTSTRLTRGEKFATALLVGLGPAAVPAAAGIVGYKVARKRAQKRASS